MSPVCGIFMFTDKIKCNFTQRQCCVPKIPTIVLFPLALSGGRTLAKVSGVEGRNTSNADHRGFITNTFKKVYVDLKLPKKILFPMHYMT